MSFAWYDEIVIDGKQTTASEWLKNNYTRYSSREAARILSGQGIGTIGTTGVQRHLGNKHDLRFSRVKRNAPRSEEEEAERVFYGIPASDIVQSLREHKTVSLKDLSVWLDRSEKTVELVLTEMVDAGFPVKREERRVVLQPYPASAFKAKPLFPHGETVEICFGVVSDTHAGSHCEQVTALQDFVHVAREEYGVQHILHGGDAFAGINVYRGQEAEVYAPTEWTQIDAVANNLPQYDDVTWYLLGGNHDYSFIKDGGPDIRRGLARQREDIVLLNYDEHKVPLLEGVDAQLWHPSGGIPYALSYRGQKGVEQLAFGELMSIVMGDKEMPTVRLLLIGHLHVMYHFEGGPISVVGAGCFEGRNSYIKRKGLVPHIGGWILQCQFVDGMLHRLTPIRIRYREIEDDWKPHYMRRKAKERQVNIMEPIFSFAE